MGSPVPRSGCPWSPFAIVGEESDPFTKPLRLVIMSATLRVSDFVENKTLFDVPPPVVQVDARQHPVAIHFDRITRADYVTQAVRKAAKIHSRLPAGGILIFLTGQLEIDGACKKLEAAFGPKAIQAKKSRQSPKFKRPLPPLFLTVSDPENPAVVSTLDRAIERECYAQDHQHHDLKYPSGAFEVEDIDLGSPQQALGADADEEHALDPEALDTQSESEENALDHLLNENADSEHDSLCLAVY